MAEEQRAEDKQRLVDLRHLDHAITRADIEGAIPEIVVTPQQADDLMTLYGREKITVLGFAPVAAFGLDTQVQVEVQPALPPQGGDEG